MWVETTWVDFDLINHSHLSTRVLCSCEMANFTVVTPMLVFAKCREPETRSPTYGCRFFRANTLARVSIFRRTTIPGLKLSLSWKQVDGNVKSNKAVWGGVTMESQNRGANEKAVNLIDKLRWRLSMATLHCCLSTLSSVQHRSHVST